MIKVKERKNERAIKKRTRVNTGDDRKINKGQVTNYAHVCHVTVALVNCSILLIHSSTIHPNYTTYFLEGLRIQGSILWHKKITVEINKKTETRECIDLHLILCEVL